jgi:glycosyltransferase involved in cell wall biosynthesis
VSEKFRYQILRTFFKAAPFPLRGDLPQSESPDKKGLLSCLVISNKLPFLDDLLEDLRFQTLSKTDFEVIVVFDGPGDEVIRLIEKHKGALNISLHQNVQPVKILSNLRNLSVSLSQGEYLLFLDDDTRIFQEDFLERALALLQRDCDVLLPQSNALFGIVKARYDFLDEFSFANRCCFYKTKTIEKIGGFLKGLHTYEDIELSIRLMIGRPKVLRTEELHYYHPPLYFDTLRKPLAIGQAIFQMRRRYSFLMWLLVYINALRFLPYGLIPGQRYRQWFKISLGVLLFPFTGKSYYY